MKVDLHTHSLHSDGTLSVAEIISQAAQLGVQQLSITDHDTLGAYEHLPKPDCTNVRLIPGCEFSALWRNDCIHIVGLNLDLESELLKYAIEIQQTAREDRAHKIGTVLEARGFSGAYEGARNAAAGAVPGRPHFAEFLCQQGYVKDRRQAFKKYLGAGKPGDVKMHWRNFDEVIGWINQSGGCAVLAHPLKYGFTLFKLRSLVADFVEAGGTGIEVISGAQDSTKTETLAALSKSFSLKASQGSDFHRPGQRWAELGNVAKLPDICDPIWTLWS